MALSFPIRFVKLKSLPDINKIDFRKTTGHTFFYHFIGWPIFIIYELTLLRILDNAAGISFPVVGYFITYPIAASLFYFHYLFVLNYCFGQSRKRLFAFIILVVFELCSYLLLIGLTKSGLVTGKGYLFSLYSDEITFIRQVWRGMYFLIFSTAAWTIQRNFDRLKKAKEIEKVALIKEQEKKNLELKLVSTQNAYLQAQINPHLLFNTLNFIYSEVHEASPMASEVIMTLSDMMRYSLLEKKADGKMELEKEIEQIQNLIRINQYRFDNGLYLQFKHSGNLDGVRITPLLLVPFVENIFKYAELTDENNPAEIQINVEDNLVEFSTFNKKKRTANFRSPGIGIENVKTRLNAYYPDKHHLDIEDREFFYRVHLQIHY